MGYSGPVSFNPAVVTSMHCMEPLIVLMLHHSITNALKGAVNLNPSVVDNVWNLNPRILDGLTKIFLCTSSSQIVIHHSIIQI
jgi:hypothetical protein